MAAPSLYRRPLPETLTPFSSPEGKRLFREALDGGTMEGYFALAEQFHTQAEPSFCGLGTLVTVLNALAIDPGRTWKGPWRWYSEELLDCCRPLDVVKREGITFGQLACLARCNGAVVDARDAGRSSLAELRHAVTTASTSAGGPHVVAAYSRAALGQTGDGHYSPIGGYHAGSDRALVLDVARFKYPPHWVPLPTLWEAMLPKDAATGKPRGYLVLGRAAAPDASLCRIAEDLGTWRAAAAQIAGALPPRAEAEGPWPLDAAIQVLLGHRLSSSKLPVELRPDGASRDQEQLFAEVRRSKLYGVVRCALDGASRVGEGLLAEQGPYDAELVTLFILAHPKASIERLPDPLRAELVAMSDPAALSAPLAAEVAHLGRQMAALDQLCCERP